MSCVTWLPKSRMRILSVAGDGHGRGIFAEARASAQACAPSPRRRIRRCRGAPATGAAWPSVRAGSARTTSRQTSRDRQQAEIGMGCEEILDLRLVLLAQQRAGGIDQPPARLHQPRGASRGSRPAAPSAPRGPSASAAICASGLRRQVPVPVQGASTSTRSKLAACASPIGSRAVESGMRWTMLAPARRSRSVARSSRLAEMSQATRWPLDSPSPPPAPGSCRRRRRRNRRRACPAAHRPAAPRAASPRPAPRSGPCLKVSSVPKRHALEHAQAQRRERRARAPRRPRASAPSRAVSRSAFSEIDAQIERRRLVAAPPSRAADPGRARASRCGSSQAG